MEEVITTDNPPVKKNRRFNTTFWLAFVALIIALASSATALVYNENMSLLLKTMSYNNQLIQRQMQQLQGMQTALYERFSAQAQLFNKNQQLVSGNHKAWILTEVNYLVRLANYNLSYTRDVPAAITLLQTADQRVAQLNDLSLNQVRQQLANNITALQAVNKLDTVGILAKLSALQLQVKQLPLISPPKFNTQTKEKDATASAQPLWRKALEQSMATLKALVVVRHHQQPIEPLLGSEQFMYLQQNLQLQLQQAQWAVLHGQKAIYQNSLLQTINWVQNYFASASPQSTAFIQAIQQLQKIDIQPVLPDMTALLNALAQAERPVTTKANNEEE